MMRSRIWTALAATLLPFAALGQPAAPAKSASATAAATPGGPQAVNVSMCTGCHAIPGYQASFPKVYRVPMIAGQSAAYIEAALLAYRKGDRNHPTMRAIAQGLDDAEIKALAAYYAARGSEATK